jgi:hypothetical protein
MHADIGTEGCLGFASGTHTNKPNQEGLSIRTAIEAQKPRLKENGRLIYLLDMAASSAALV